MSLALTRLTFHYFAEPTLACCLVPLPLWYNPFLLQNLSYQYDGPIMALSMVAAIYAITFEGSSRVQRWLVPAALLALAIGLYQISFNVFLGLCCVELIRAVQRRTQGPEILRMLGWKLAQAGLGILIYSVTAYPFMETLRKTDLLNLDAIRCCRSASISLGSWRKSRCCFTVATRGFSLRWCCVLSLAVCDWFSAARTVGQTCWCAC